MANLAKIQEAIEKLEAKKQTRFEALNAKFVKLTEKRDKILEKIQVTNNLIDELETKNADMSAKITEIEVERDSLAGTDDNVNAETESATA